MKSTICFLFFILVSFSPASSSTSHLRFTRIPLPFSIATKATAGETDSATTNSPDRDTFYLKVHFLYGSKPKKAYKATEPKWFGGILGGHVGIEGDSNRIVDFSPREKFHVFAQKNNKNSHFALRTRDAFYSILGSHPDSVKTAIVYIPVTPGQKARFDSISRSYIKQTPYDYAFFGMRCAAAGYDILSQLDILPEYGQTQTCMRIFYPKLLRKQLLEMAETHNWRVIRSKGSSRRKWEKD